MTAERMNDRELRTRKAGRGAPFAIPNLQLPFCNRSPHPAGLASNRIANPQFPNPPAPRRCGFTLVEMLVVIVIIGILAGLITGAALQARVTAKNYVIFQEIKQLEVALNEYKNKYGDYPPDFTDTTAVTRHLAKAFPRYPAGDYLDPLGNKVSAPGPGILLRWQFNLKAANIDYASLDPSTAIVIWLGGIPSFDPGTGKVTALNGFCLDPANPFSITAGNQTAPLYPSFALSRLKSLGTTLRTVQYLPDNGNESSEPYVYFRPGYYTLAGPPPLPDVDMSVTPPRLKTKSWTSAVTTAVVRPYWDAEQIGLLDVRFAGNPTGYQTYLQQFSSANALWVNPTTFQILSPGLNGSYWGGLPELQPANAFLTGSSTAALSGTYTQAQYDDITNFSDGTLGNKKP